MKNLINSIFIIFAVLLSACGGGGGSAGDTGSGTTATVSIIEVQSDKNTITNSGVDSSLLTITALDEKRNPVSGAAVAVSLSSGIYTSTAATTDASGVAKGSISAGENKSNRTITATVKIGSQTRTVNVAVTGSKISVSANPAVPVPNGPVTVSAKVVDVNGNGISGTAVKFSGTLGFTQQLVTDTNGNVTGVLAAAPSTSGSYTINAEAAGVSSLNTVQVSLPGNSGIPDAVGVISSDSLAIVPNTIGPNSSGRTTSRAGLRAVFQDASNKAIVNVRARFEIVAPGLGAGEFISTGDATLYSNVNGEVLSEYVAGSRTSPTNGVSIRVCYGFTDASIAGGACPNSIVSTMTVANQPLSITLGEDNIISKGNGTLTYIKRYDIAVNDAAGNPVSNAPLSASVDITGYDKGFFAGPRITCANEDINRNGFLDAGEDVNNSRSIEPRKADVIIYFEPGTAVTGINGRSIVLVEWPQNVATWLPFNITVSTSVAGSEGRFTKSFRTTAAEDDITNGSFLRAPYGSDLDCTLPPP